tara:strand:- start:2184 stop:2591 length:408 start_codon:yes stop_codon:yes gene_type:complete
MDDRPVKIRTSASAQDFWSRERDYGKIDTCFHVINKQSKLLPYQRQQKPFDPFITAQEIKHKSTQTDVEQVECISMDEVYKLKAYKHILEARNRALNDQTKALNRKIDTLNGQVEKMYTAFHNFAVVCGGPDATK